MKEINTAPRGQIFKEKHTRTASSSVPQVASIVHPVFTFGNTLSESKEMEVMSYYRHLSPVLHELRVWKKMCLQTLVVLCTKNNCVVFEQAAFACGCLPFLSVSVIRLHRFLCTVENNSLLSFGVPLRLRSQLQVSWV